MERVGVVGCVGRMGKCLVRQVAASDECILAGGTVRHESMYVGRDIGEECGVGTLGTLISSDTPGLFEVSDVVLDFTTPEGAGHHLKWAYDFQKPLVIGTTGLNDLHARLIEDVGKKVPLLIDTNMSLGITLLKSLVEEVARILNKNFDVDILEMHHRHKKDAPSGTSYDLGKAVARGRALDFQKAMNRNRTYSQTERGENEIGFSVMRGGNVIGDHSVHFASETELVTLSHRALSREVYAEGAVKGAIWLLHQKPGVYTMKDVLRV